MPSAVTSTFAQLVFFLPIGTEDELFAAGEVATHLLQKYRGYTRSALQGEGRFAGHFVNNAGEDMMDFVLHLVVLAPLPALFEENLKELHDLAHNAYVEGESPQDEIWIVHSQISVYSDVRS
jgi:hypothetical protein